MRWPSVIALGKRSVARRMIGRCADLADGKPLRVPHIGWNTVRWSGDHPMLAGLPAEDCYYFVHSYRAVPARDDLVAGVADYGGELAAAVARERIFAVQFHPEKSQMSGKRLLDAYAAWVEECR